MKVPTLKGLREGIENEITHIFVKPFSRKKIQSYLDKIGEMYGEEEREKAVQDLRIGEETWGS